MALNLKGVGYEVLEEVPGTRSALILESNTIYKKMPVVIHNGKPESMIIVQYIDEVWAAEGPSILPSDPYDHAIARIWAVYIDDKKANVVADALSRKFSDELAALITSQKPILLDLEKSGIEIRLHDSQIQLANLVLQPTLIEKIKAAQKEDSELQKVIED
uniref:Glutathione S-transferase n=1 Tax=Elaeis guineensis var. tenera TaxID=51953 RepID=A0A6I9R2M9_ELAGV|nr:glutathione S-transferase U17-like [Elaeis guineensis]